MGGACLHGVFLRLAGVDADIRGHGGWRYNPAKITWGETAAMSQTRHDFLDLSVAERIQLAEDLWDSIATENPEAAALTPTQLQEIQIRLDAHEQDPSSAVPWTQVRSELFEPKR